MKTTSCMFSLRLKWNTIVRSLKWWSVVESSSFLWCRNFTLLEAWSALKQVHRRAQPNDGFAKILVDLDRNIHGKVSMEWQQRKPMMKVCPICGKNAGLSSSSLKLHLQKSHKKLSSGSVDSAMTMEIQKALTALKINRGGSVSPTQRQSHSIMDESD